MARLVFLESCRFHRYEAELKRMVRHAVKYFPELADETIYVGVLEKCTEIGKASSINRLIMFRVDVKPTYTAIFHELMHIATRVLHEKGHRVPYTSEEYCSIAAMARMPPSMVDSDTIPYIGKARIPRHLIPKVCQQALEYRKHHRNYIQYLTKLIHPK